MTEDYTTVTELPGNRITNEQLSRLYQRYRFALPFCKDKEILEVACGGGMGLGYLAKVAKKVVGGDIDKNILKFAIDHYKKRYKIELRIIDAHDLPFEDKSFDVVILYEAIYYLDHPEKFIREARRVLRANGILLICTVNKDWPDFNPSLHSRKYFSVPELCSLIDRNFLNVEIYGAFPASSNGIKNKTLSYIKRASVALHLIPKTMKGKEKFKRIFFGRLTILPPEIEDGMADYLPPAPISDAHPNHQHKILFAVGHV